jgi:4-hydroxy-tetrahydrodipicolinate reductase
MRALRVALVGMGRMGRAIDALAGEHECEIVARFDRARVTCDGISRESLGGADVAIEFSVPDAALDNASACLRAGVPVVIGTTGWTDRLPELTALSATHGVSVLWAPNFSPGVQLFLALVEAAGHLFRHAPAFDAHLVETHHAAKLDAPSGTAIAVQARTERALNRPVPVTSVRVGSVPGTHALTLDAPFESVTVVHEARDRRVFADGALAAARWLVKAPAGGVYSMRDVLGLGTAEGRTP